MRQLHSPPKKGKISNPTLDQNLSIFKAHSVTHLSKDPFQRTYNGFHQHLKSSCSTPEERTRRMMTLSKIVQTAKKNERHPKINTNSSQERRGGRTNKQRHLATSTLWGHSGTSIQLQHSTTGARAQSPTCTAVRNGAALTTPAVIQGALSGSGLQIPSSR